MSKNKKIYEDADFAVYESAKGYDTHFFIDNKKVDSPPNDWIGYGYGGEHNFLVLCEDLGINLPEKKIDSILSDIGLTREYIEILYQEDLGDRQARLVENSWLKEQSLTSNIESNIPTWKIIKCIECYINANEEAFNIPPYYDKDNIDNLLNDDIIDEDTWDLIQQNRALKDILDLVKNPVMLDRNLELYGIDPAKNPYPKLEDDKNKNFCPEEIFDNLDINYSGSLENGYFTLSFFTDTAGQDCNFELEFEPNDFNSFSKACAGLSNTYDVEDQVALFLEAKQNGFAGVPDVETLLDDCKEVRNTLDKLSVQVSRQNNLQHNKKPDKAINNKNRVVDSIKPEKATKDKSLGDKVR